MERSASPLGVHWRAVRRLSPSQVLGRLRLRSRQFGLRLAGLQRLVPRHRRALAPDCLERVQALSRLPNGVPPAEWCATAGTRFRANSGWLISHSGRTMRYRRDLARLELYYHEFLHDRALSAAEAWSFLSEYLRDHRTRASDGRHEWHPYAVSNRLASWLAFLAHHPDDADDSLKQQLLEECLLLTDYVEWMLERDLEANHLLKNLWAIALSDRLLNADTQRQQQSIQRYVDEFARQILSDGGHYELSPMYHAKVLYDARVMLALLDRDPMAEQLRALSDRATRWLEALRFGPDQWANINDSWSIPTLAQHIWRENPEPVRDGVTELPASGFLRGNLGPWQWLFDVGGVSPKGNPGHCHSDALSVLLYFDGQPLIVDPGVLHYSPNDERLFLRSCHAHNGPCLRQWDHTELIGSFRIGRAAHANLQGHTAAPSQQTATGYHNGYRGIRIQRHLEVTTHRVTFLDDWITEDRQPFAPWSRFLWRADLEQIEECRPDTNRLKFTFRHQHQRFGVSIRVRSRGTARLALQDSWYSDEFGRTRPAAETLATGDSTDGPAQVETVVTLVA